MAKIRLEITPRENGGYDIIAHVPLYGIWSRYKDGPGGWVKDFGGHIHCYLVRALAQMIADGAEHWEVRELPDD